MDSQQFISSIEVSNFEAINKYFEQIMALYNVIGKYEIDSSIIGDTNISGIQFRIKFESIDDYYLIQTVLDNNIIASFGSICPSHVLQDSVNLILTVVFL